MQVKTDHQVVAFGSDLMHLFDSEAGIVLVSATRGPGGEWTITALDPPNPVADVTASSRTDALTAMTEHVFNALGPSGPNGEGYSTLIPHGMSELP